jgi:hypothetical protein
MARSWRRNSCGRDGQPEFCGRELTVSRCLIQRRASACNLRRSLLKPHQKPRFAVQSTGLRALEEAGTNEPQSFMRWVDFLRDGRV